MKVNRNSVSILRLYYNRCAAFFINISLVLIELILSSLDVPESRAETRPVA